MERSVQASRSDGEAGLVHTAKNGSKVYIAAEQDMDVAGMKYAIVCRHGCVIGATSKKDAILIARNPSNFCNDHE